MRWIVQAGLAQAYLSNGEGLQAKQNSLLALEIAPTFQPAQRALLKALDMVTDD